MVIDIETEKPISDGEDIDLADNRSQEYRIFKGLTSNIFEDSSH